MNIPDQTGCFRLSSGTCPSHPARSPYGAEDRIHFMKRFGPLSFVSAAMVLLSACDLFMPGDPGSADAGPTTTSNRDASTKDASKGGGTLTAHTGVNGGTYSSSNGAMV